MLQVAEAVRSFEIGEWSEGYDWEFIEGGEFPASRGMVMACKHATYRGDRKSHPAGTCATGLPCLEDHSVHSDSWYRVPRMVRAYNECHNNETLMCLDCVLEATR